MTSDDTQRPHNGWVPPESRPDRLPPYAPRPRDPDGEVPVVPVPFADTEAEAAHESAEENLAEAVQAEAVPEVADVVLPAVPEQDPAAAEAPGDAVEADAVAPDAVGADSVGADAPTEVVPVFPEAAADELPSSEALSEPALLSGADTAGADDKTQWIPTMPAAGAAWSAADAGSGPAADADSGAAAGDATEVVTATRSRRRRDARSTGRGKDPIRTAARGIGQTLITLGTVVLLFVVYEVYITDIFGAQKQAQAVTALEEKWEQAAAETGGVVTAVVTAPVDPQEQEVDPAERKQTYDLSLGDAFAKIFIPAFGADYSRAIIEGTNPDDLYVGPGHYTYSQLPGATSRSPATGSPRGPRSTSWGR